MEDFSAAKLIIFGVVFLFFFSIPVLTINQIKKVDNENKVKNDFKQIEAWAQIYKIQNGTFEGFENDIEIRMIKIDLIATTGEEMQMFFDDNYNSFCVKARTNKDNVYCIDDSGYMGKDASGCYQGSGRCRLK